MSLLELGLLDELLNKTSELRSTAHKIFVRIFTAKYFAPDADGILDMTSGLVKVRNLIRGKLAEKLLDLVNLPSVFIQEFSDQLFSGEGAFDRLSGTAAIARVSSNTKFVEFQGNMALAGFIAITKYLTLFPDAAQQLRQKLADEVWEQIAQDRKPSNLLSHIKGPLRSELRTMVTEIFKTDIMKVRDDLLAALNDKYPPL